MSLVGVWRLYYALKHFGHVVRRIDLDLVSGGGSMELYRIFLDCFNACAALD